MRKPIVRVVFAVLISLIVIAGIYTSVLGASLHAGTKSGQVHVDASLMPDLKHQLSSIRELQSVVPQVESPGRNHDCHSDVQTDPND